jgi:hypothetical protein
MERRMERRRMEKGKRGVGSSSPRLGCAVHLERGSSLHAGKGKLGAVIYLRRPLAGTRQGDLRHPGRVTFFHQNFHVPQNFHGANCAKRTQTATFHCPFCSFRKKLRRMRARNARVAFARLGVCSPPFDPGAQSWPSSPRPECRPGHALATPPGNNSKDRREIGVAEKPPGARVPHSQILRALCVAVVKHRAARRETRQNLG